MGIHDRPYVGTWRLGRQKLVQHTPDALVYINGLTTLPGCQKCNSRIDIQKFITEVSVDAGTEPGGASASFSLSIPIHSLDSFCRDAQFILHPGLEVHVYMRGYFPVRGLYSNLNSPLAPEEPGAKGDSVFAPGTEFETVTRKDIPPVMVEALDRAQQQKHWTSDRRDNAELIYRMFVDAGYSPAFAMAMIAQAQGESTLYAGAINTNSETKKRVAFGLFQLNVNGNALGTSNPNFEGGKTAGSADTSTTYNALDPATNISREILAADSIKSIGGQNGMGRGQGRSADSMADVIFSSPLALGTRQGYIDLGETEEDKAKRAKSWDAQQAKRRALGRTMFGSAWTDAGFSAEADAQTTVTTEKVVKSGGGVVTPFPVNTQPGMLDQTGMGGFDIENILAYPYYQVFHGVVTSVNFSYSGGVQTAGVQCASMLHFWQYHQMSTNASVFGRRPENSKLKMSLVGHNFTGWHPYQIIYYLHHDTAGAAGGVSWALSQKTDQDARSPVTNESLFGLNIRYWQQRFNKQEIRLRLHGATGELFNSAQAAFLSTTSSSALLRIVEGRFNHGGPADESNNKSIFGQAAALGMFNNRKLEALGVAKNPDGSPKMDLNLVEMQAFINNLGQWGQVQLFESTYESKLDVATKVCEVTGFEFYQDVDGDFVFKPPMYNLDTSDSRVYRIEDIDIISINFDEKEPQVTYMTAKGNHFQNFVGTGTENEWGVQGQYIDFRLVAQYGWRPGNFETAYFTDPRQMFFAAMNRLDIMNAPTKSASLTIPIRPELRPGYPVYIPYLDCFYYCNSFAHSFSVGGQCTTSLQLVAKRAKFYAPGDPNDRGISAVHLENPALPQRPLQVLDSSGQPRLAGFPNVVMALDPDQLNPLFFIVGGDLDDLSDPTTMQSFLKIGVQMGVLTTEDPDNPGPLYTMYTGKGTAMTLYFNNGEPAISGTVDIAKLADAYTAKRQQLVKTQQQAQDTLDKDRQALSDFFARRQTVKLTGKDTAGKAASVESIDAEIDRLETKINAAVTAFRLSEQQNPLEADAELAPLVELIKQVSGRYFSEGKFSSEYGNFNDTATLLEMLSDKKAVFTNGSLPGSYRYYSASHPIESQQGQPLLSIDMLWADAKANAEKSDTVKKTLKTQSPYLDPLWQDQKVLGYLKQEGISIPTGASEPEAQMGEMTPKMGLRVLTSNPLFAATGEIVPTSEIREMMFAVHEVTQPTKKTSNTSKIEQVDLGPEWCVFLMNDSQQKIGTPSAADSFNSATGDGESSILAKVEAAYTAAKAVPGAPADLPTVPYKSITTIPYKGYLFPMDVPLSTYKFADTSGTITPFAGSEQMTTATFWPLLAAAEGEAVYRSIRKNKAEWVALLKGYDPKLFSALVTAFVQSLASSLAGKSVSRDQIKVRQNVPSKKSIHSPVFPISDAKGYEVIGSYRYGRDINIDPNGAFDVMHRQDPLSLLDRETVESIVDAFIRGKPIWMEVEQVNNGVKTIKKVLMSGPQARTALQERVLAFLRRNLTDDQLIDLHLADYKNGDPTMLELNLMNWFADQKKDGLQKVPLVNAAYSLGDLSPVAGMTTCSCKAAEANIMLESAGRQDFVQFTPAKGGDAGITEDTDPLTQWLLTSTTEASIAWRQSQDALRGAVPDQSGSSIVNVIQGLDDQFSAAARGAEQGVASLKAQAQAQYEATSEAIESAFTSEE